MTREERRLNRQLDALSKDAPFARRALHALRHGPLRYVRIPLAILLTLGGFLAVLPVFGLWMIPLGLILLAIDIPLLRPAVSAAIVRLRRRWRRWTGRARNGNGNGKGTGPAPSG
jgi:hypothetical protein